MKLSTPHRCRPLTIAWALVAAAGLYTSAQAATPEELLASYVKQAGAPASAERGQQFFTASRKGEFGWNCASCHGSTPTGNGKHELTEKRIAPLAPAFNPTRFTDLKKTDGWFRTNCKDVLGRECSAQEKADVLSWLLTLKP
jgi:cytochrome c553